MDVRGGIPICNSGLSQSEVDQVQGFILYKKI